MHDLAPIAYPDGTLAIAAFDHRNSLLELLNPQNPQTVSASTVVALKRLFIKSFADISSAILIDPVYGLDYGIDLTTEVPKSCGLLMSLEASSYDESAAGRMTQLLPNWDVADIKTHHASAKLLLYYHPDAPIAKAQLQLVASLSQKCRTQNIPFLVEPILYGVGEYSSRNALDVTLKTIDQLNALVDILKLEFPVNVLQSSESDWKSVGATISRHATVPWILLSRGMGYPHFKRLTKICCTAGAAGIAVGRAVWQEIETIAKSNLDTPETLLPDLEKFLGSLARTRMLELIDIVHHSARPWNR